MDSIEKQLKDLTQKFSDFEGLFYKNNFSNMQIFDKNIQFKSGLIPKVLSAVPIYIALEGETVLVNDGSSTRQICSYLSGSWRCQSYGQTSGIANLVEDTTPQLGGDLDTNGKAITSESGYIERYTISKTLQDNTDTDILSVQMTTAGACSITVRYIHSLPPTSSYNASEAGERVTMFSTDGSTQAVNRADDMYLNENENGGATTTTTWTQTMSTNNKITLSLLVNNNVDVSEKFYAEVVIVSTVPFTYTKL